MTRSRPKRLILELLEDRCTPAAYSADVAATFIDVVPTDNPTIANQNNTLRWGDALEGSGKSSLTISQGPINTTTGQEFKLATLTYYNGVGTAGTEAESFNLKLILWRPDSSVPAGARLGNIIKVPFSISTTLNEENFPTDSADALFRGVPSTPQKVTINSQPFELQILGFRNPSGGFVAQFTDTDDFTVLEKQTATIELFAKLVGDEDPDDTTFEAKTKGVITPKTTPTIRTDEITGPPDVDMYAFTVAAGDRIGFDVDTVPGTTPQLRSYLRLFDGAGQMLSSNQHGSATGEPVNADNFDSYMAYTFTKAGTYYLGISNRLNTAYNAITGTGDNQAATAFGPYQLSVQKLPAITAKLVNGKLFIAGTELDDSISVILQSDGDTITVQTDGWTNTNFGNVPIRVGGKTRFFLYPSEVKAICICAKEGNDTLTNQTNLPSLIYGGDGADIITGGSSFDNLFGDEGADTLVGGPGADHFYASIQSTISDAQSDDVGFKFSSATSLAWTVNDVNFIAVNVVKPIELASGGETTLLKPNPMNTTSPFYQFEFVAPIPNPSTPGKDAFSESDANGFVIRISAVYFREKSISQLVKQHHLVHEFGHSWDSVRENPAVKLGNPAGGTVFGFHAFSEWRHETSSPGADFVPATIVLPEEDPSKRWYYRTTFLNPYTQQRTPTTFFDGSANPKNYAKIHPREDFSEVFAAVILKEDTSNLKAKAYWMRTWIASI